MSATASFTNPEPPPLLFGSPRSPFHNHTPTSPPPAAMEEPEDIDMTTSTILPAQNHDRQGDAMEEDGEAAPQPAQDVDRTSSGNDEAAAEDGDAMDIPAGLIAAA